MAEAKRLAEEVDKQTKVIEETIECREALKEDLVVVFCEIDNLPPEELQRKASGAASVTPSS
eukprot:6479606-Amphidinium_carterae.1